MTSKNPLANNSVSANSQQWALVTGASTGLGWEFCRILAKAGYNIVLVARTESTLLKAAENLQSEFTISTEVLVADLAQVSQLEKVESRLASADKPVSVLINNAGFGVGQKFYTGSISDELQMIDVLIVAVMRLTHAAIQNMRPRGYGEIVVVSSVASFIAGGTYSSAKAWATFFAESVNVELNGTGIHISALCPGFTHTEFHQRAGIAKSAIPDFLWLDAKRVVSEGWQDHLNRKAISIPSKRFKLIVFLGKVLPRNSVRKINSKIRNRRSL